ncbi:hypothetical protein V1509DRAFT_617893 [Lipomyces kononenkoae]
MGLLRSSVNLYRQSSLPPPQTLPSRRCKHATARGDCQVGHGSGQNVDEMSNKNNRIPCLDVARWAYSRHCEDYFHMPHSTTPSESLAQNERFGLYRSLVRDVILRVETVRVRLLIAVVLDLAILYVAWKTLSIDQIGSDTWAGLRCWMGVCLFGCGIGFVYALVRHSMILVGLETGNAEQGQDNIIATANKRKRVL